MTAAGCAQWHYDVYKYQLSAYKLQIQSREKEVTGTLEVAKRLNLIHLSVVIGVFCCDWLDAVFAMRGSGISAREDPLNA
jgi:hypothetical protein